MLVGVGGTGGRISLFYLLCAMSATGSGNRMEDRRKYFLVSLATNFAQSEMDVVSLWLR